jgi:3'-phosphoadenosine 5'-phosphosulfate (PAPS) 3'-phosphatase
LARGDAQLYPRFAPTCFWDIAAGHAILKAAGGVVLNLNAEPMTYPGNKADFLNSRFVAAANQSLALRAIEHMSNLPS